MKISPRLIQEGYQLVEAFLEVQKQETLQQLMKSNSTEIPVFNSYCEMRKYRLCQMYGFSYRRHRTGIFRLPLLFGSSSVIFDSSLLGELFYHQFMDPSPNRKEKRRNIHQQLEENPDEISQDSDSDQSMVYNIDPAPTSPFASFYVRNGDGVRG